MTQTLQCNFASRQELVAFVRELAPWADGNESDTCGGRAPADALMNAIAPVDYAKTRNYGDGKVTRLSPYIRHGIVSLNEVRNRAVATMSDERTSNKLVQELAWRDYWQRVAAQHPDWLWNDAEPYKTGYGASEYADTLPLDIIAGNTGIACLDAFIAELTTSGYLHNHARMYLAAYVVHFRRVRWQAGAAWFLQHLLDGDAASNNLSWQWVASTFSDKPYIFNLENVRKYVGSAIDTTAQNNVAIDASYEELHQKLFPNNEEQRQ